ncbi:18142_t:CDS:1, partial [Gigaspora margarita]
DDFSNDHLFANTGPFYNFDLSIDTRLFYNTFELFANTGSSYNNFDFSIDTGLFYNTFDHPIDASSSHKPLTLNDSSKDYFGNDHLSIDTGSSATKSNYRIDDHFGDTDLE